MCLSFLLGPGYFHFLRFMDSYFFLFFFHVLLVSCVWLQTIIVLLFYYKHIFYSGFGVLWWLVVYPIIYKEVILYFFKMVFSGSKFDVSDNSGAKFVRCVKVVGALRGMEGSNLVISIRRSKLNANLISKGKIFRAVLSQCKKSSFRRLGVRISFSGNRVILLRKDGAPMANRITRTISFSLRKFNFVKVVVLAPLCL